MIQFIDRPAAPEFLLKIGRQNPIFLQRLNHRLSLLSERTENISTHSSTDWKVEHQNKRSDHKEIRDLQFGLKCCNLAPSSDQC